MQSNFTQGVQYSKIVDASEGKDGKKYIGENIF